MRAKVATIALLLVSVCDSAVRQHYGVIGEFQHLVASSALLLPSINVSNACMQQTQLVLQEAEKLNLWALKILDSTAKVPPGILNGNLNQFGDFDLCLGSRGSTSRDEIVTARYCLADFNIIPKDKRLKEIDDLTHSNRALTGHVSDLGQRLPKLSSWRWGVCIPSACTADDLKVHLHEFLSKSLGHAANVEVYVDPMACYTAQKPPLTFGHYFTIFLFIAFISGVLLGTAQESFSLYPKTKTISSKVLECFSFQKNWSRLVSTEPEGEDIEIVNGAKGLNALALLLCHKQMAYLFTPFVNSVTMGEQMDGTISLIGRSAYMYTESFVLLSGLLIANSTLKELERSGTINILRNLPSRYIKFTPNLLFLILTTTYIMDFFGSGPLWGHVIDKYSTLCKNNMWQNLLYIHNFNGWDNMCLTNTHQLALDMQLYLISPIVVYILWKSPTLGVLLSATIGAFSCWLRYTTVSEKGINYTIHYGSSIQALFDTGTFSYSLPAHRAVVYCIGLVFGYAMRCGYTKINLSTTSATVGWSAATAAAMFAFFGSSQMGKKDYIYDPYEVAFYNTWQPIAWSFFIVWSGIACWNNSGGWVNKLLTWRYFRVFSRISYAFYLVQFPIFFFNVGRIRHSHFYISFNIFNLEEFTAVLVASIILTLVVDMPCQNMKRIFLAPPKSNKSRIAKDKNGSATQREKTKTHRR